jgi:hypothetical protein
MNMKKLTQTVLLCLMGAALHAQSDCQFWPVFPSGSRTAAIPGGSTNNSMTISYSPSGGNNLTGPSAYNVVSAMPAYFTPNPTTNTFSPPNRVAHSTGDLGMFSIYPIRNSDRGTISFASPTTTPFRIHVYQLKSRMLFSRNFTVISTDGSFPGLSVGSSSNVLDARWIWGDADDANATIEFPAGISSVGFDLQNDGNEYDGAVFAFSFPEPCICSDYSYYYRTQEANDKQVKAIQAELTRVQTELQIAERQLAIAAPATKDKAVLLGCSPNPATGETVVRYYLPAAVQSAQCVISTAEGKVVRSYSLGRAKGQGQQRINVADIGAAGSYMYSLQVNNITVDSKKLVIQR